MVAAMGAAAAPCWDVHVPHEMCSLCCALELAPRFVCPQRLCRLVGMLGWALSLIPSLSYDVELCLGAWGRRRRSDWHFHFVSLLEPTMYSVVLKWEKLLTFIANLRTLLPSACKTIAFGLRSGFTHTHEWSWGWISLEHSTSSLVGTTIGIRLCPHSV